MDPEVFDKKPFLLQKKLLAYEVLRNAEVAETMDE